MNNEIIIISTTGAVTEKVKSVLKIRQLDFPVYEATMEKALEISLDEISKGTKVVVCRGGTTAFLRERIDVPVVDIRHGFIDIHLSVQSAKMHSDKIGVLGYSNLCDAARDYVDIMNTELPIVEIKHKNEMEEKLLILKSLGVKAVIGGMQLGEIAKRHGMINVMGEADPAAINQSIDEALHDLKIEHERKEKFETINAILNSTSEGIIAIDKMGYILHINKIAKKIFAYEHQDHINEVIPHSKILDTALTGIANFGEFLKTGNDSIVVNSVPIKIEGQTIGAVATIQEELKIQTIDHEIRRKNLGNGRIAKKTFRDIIGSSNEIMTAIRQASKYAKSDSTVLIHGETGTGKEIFAQSIHNYSKRQKQPFVAINCAALPENILESELFGYVSGAFTGASKDGKPGIFELAHNGTVFLDEIGEISINVQVKLLRVLQEKEVSRIGDDKVIPIDVRILAASNKNLVDEIQKGLFREDLYFRLCVLELELPPLRSRKEDIKELVHYFIREKSLKNLKVSDETIKYFENYDWPGNIRQLSNVIERLIVTSDEGLISNKLAVESLKQIPVRMEKHEDMADKSALDRKILDALEKLLIFNSRSFLDISKDAYELEPPNFENVNSLKMGNSDMQFFEREVQNAEGHILIEALNKFSGNREQTARYLGISKATLWRKMKRLNLI